MTTVILGGGGIGAALEGIQVPKSECDIRHRISIQDTLEVYNPDVVIVTAGISNPDAIEDARFEEEINVNLIGSFNVAQMAIKQGVEKLIFIASVAGLHGKPFHSAYSASKAGIISLVQSLGHEGHLAWAIAPGRVNTPMRQKDYPSDTPGSRLEPHRLAEVVTKILLGHYEPGSSIMVRKIGLTKVVEEVVPTPWCDELKVGQPLTI